MTDQYVWLRREGETSPAYDAFRTYLNMGGARSLEKVCESVGKSWQLITKWSAQWSWVERCRAYDSHVQMAQTDGLVNQLASVREKHIELADKLLDHLDKQLDTCIEKKWDPSVRWTQAFTAAIKAHQGAFLMKDHERQTEQLNQALDLLRRFEDAETREPQ